jgi:hypothetical protein
MRYIFLDESGNWVFSKKGTQYLVFTSLVTENPHLFDIKLSNLKHAFLRDGHDISEFHASEDKQFVRNKVFECLREEGGYEIDSVVIEKCKTDPALVENPGRLYRKVFSVLLKYVLSRHSFSKIIIFTDSLPNVGKKEELKKGLKIAIKEIVPDKPFHIYHHPSNSHYCLQAVDYCSWAIYKNFGNWGKPEPRPLGEISEKIMSVFDYFKSGDDTAYY